MEKRIAHLQMIQGVINRMAGNSFLLKGWCVTLVSALIALAAKDNNVRFLIAGYYPVLMFWMLDAYFLWQERLFRRLYDVVREKNDDEKTDFSMNTAAVAGEVKGWLQAAFSKTVLLFYGTMVGAILVAILIVR
jgi:hypothetical protein